MDMLTIVSYMILCTIIFHFNMIVNVIMFLFLIMSLFKMFKTWMGMMVFLVYLGGFLILLIYISSFSSKKLMKMNYFLLFGAILLMTMDWEKNWFFSDFGFDFLTNIFLLILFSFFLLLFLFLLFSVGMFIPTGKSLRSL